MFTPGPWSVSAEDEGIFVIGDNDVCVAQMMINQEWPTRGDSKQDWDNAFLIAAAPDLLKACKHIVRYWAALGIDEQTYRLCSGAIQKAAAT